MLSAGARRSPVVRLSGLPLRGWAGHAHPRGWKRCGCPDRGVSVKRSVLCLKQDADR